MFTPLCRSLEVFSFSWLTSFRQWPFHIHVLCHCAVGGGAIATFMLIFILMFIVMYDEGLMGGWGLSIINNHNMTLIRVHAVNPKP